MQNLESQLEESLENHPEYPDEKAVQTLEAQTENVRKYSILQRHIIPAHQHAIEKGATSDPHYDTVPQTIWETMDSGWAMRRDGVDENKNTKTYGKEYIGIPDRYEQFKLTTESWNGA